MTKTGHQQPPTPVDPGDTITKAFADATYAGGGPIAAAQGAFIEAHLSGDQTQTFVADDLVLFDTTARVSGELLVTAGVFTGLKAGRTYFLHASLTHSDATAHRIPWVWYDRTNAQKLGSVGVGVAAGFAGTGVYPGIAHAIVRPLTDIDLDVRCAAASNNAGDLTLDANNGWGEFNCHAQIIEIGAVQADVVGGLEFMDIITVNAPTASVSFGAAGDGAFKRALDGDVDQTYVLVHRISKTSTMTTADIKPNGIGTNQVSRRVTMESSAATFPRLVISQPGAAGFESGTTEFDAGSGRQRSFHSEASLQTADVPTEVGQFGRTYTGTWNDTATNIISLEIATNDASAGIDIGSEFVLYRRTRTNLRADSAAVYERNAIEVVDPGALATTERTTGHSTYGGSVVGISVRVEDAVTAGTITCNVKVDGVTALTAVLDTTNATSRVVRAAIGLHKFAADKNISVEFVPSSYDNAGSVPSSVTVQIHLTNDALINPPQNAVGGLQFVDVINVIGDQQTVTFGVGGDGDNNTPLDGDLDEEYLILGDIFTGAAAAIDFTWRPNGASTGQECNRTTASNNGIFGALHAELRISNQASLAIGTLHRIESTIRAKSGQFRTFIGESVLMEGATVTEHHTFGGGWDDIAANITSIEIRASVASGIKDGSKLTLYKIVRPIA
jgi:hypothetical protein